MTRPPQHIQEDLSKAYVQAIIASAGAEVQITSQTEYGIDAIMRQVIQTQYGYTNSGPPISIQIKSTTNWDHADGLVIFDLSAIAYNKLTVNKNTPTILVMFQMPKNQIDWITQCEEFLQLRNCCYYMIAPNEPVENSSSIRIRIPRNQLFNEEAVNHLFSLVHQGRGSF